MKISYYKGFEEVQDGISAYSRTMNAYTFGAKETGATSSEGKKEIGYYVAVFAQQATESDVKTDFIRSFMELKGFPIERQTKILYEKGKELIEMNAMLAVATLYADNIYNPLPKLDIVKRLKQIEVEAYDKTDAVNEFTVQGHKTWYTHDRRNSLGSALAATKATGLPTFQFVDVDWTIEISIDDAIRMHQQLELYAMNCLINTNRHLSAISKLTTIEDVEKYDYTTGYPEKLNL